MKTEIKAVNLDVPYSHLPEDIKQWIRENGYVIKETDKSAITLEKWRVHYTKYLDEIYKEKK